MPGKIKKTAILIVLSALFLLIGFQVYTLNAKRIDLKNVLSDVNSQVGELEIDNDLLDADIEYFADPENLAKEFKSKFNYKRPGEELIIVVPKENNY
ncbi:MAG: hypothetical protein Q8O87_01690 [bacterium]|nr:hypothetical protein [bacterium]